MAKQESEIADFSSRCLRAADVMIMLAPVPPVAVQIAGDIIQRLRKLVGAKSGGIKLE